MNRPIYIRFINWEKYNPRKELKSLSWLRLDADIGFSESLFGLNAESKWLWIFLLSYSAKKNSDTIHIDLDYINYHSSVKKENIFKYVELFISKGLVELNQIDPEPDRIRTNPIESVSYVRTYEHNVHNIQDADPDRNEVVVYVDSGIHEHPLEIIPMSEKTQFKQKANEVAMHWNEMAKLYNLPKVKLPLSKDRLDAIKPALARFPTFMDWHRIIDEVATNPFNLGDNDRKWKANFDWLFYKTKFNYRKLWESSRDETN